jgi:hypothetical protein
LSQNPPAWIGEGRLPNDAEREGLCDQLQNSLFEQLRTVKRVPFPIARSDYSDAELGELFAEWQRFEANFRQGLRGRQPVSHEGSDEQGVNINNGYAQSASSGGDVDYSVWGSTDTDCGSVGHEQLRRSQVFLGNPRDYVVEAPTDDNQLHTKEACDGGSSVISIRSTRD